MESLMLFFVGLVAVAVVLQTALLAGMYVQFRRTNQRIEQIAQDLHERVQPFLLRVQTLVEDAQPRISSMLSDTAEITHLARAQVQRVDRLVAEAADRLRLQLLHADQILTGALEAVEETGSRVRRGVSRPLQSIIALIRGVQIGIDFYRGGSRHPTDAPTEQQDETLFI